MPTYEYACRSCGEHLEVVQSFRDDPLSTCPNCEGELRKVFSAAGIIFKGSGWHIKDYAGKTAASPASAGTGKSASDTASSSSDASSSEKPAGDKASSGKAEGGTPSSSAESA
jgi:putative FmdB family regulatory protein